MLFATAACRCPPFVLQGESPYLKRVPDHGVVIVVTFASALGHMHSNRLVISIETLVAWHVHI